MNDHIQPPVDAFGMERRTIPALNLEVRDAVEDGAIGFRGHAAVFNSVTIIAGLFEEKVAPGAFAKTIREEDVRFLINHNPDLVLARNRAGTLRLSEDDVGLLTEADMAPTTFARDLETNLRARNVDQMSFGFLPIKDEWDFDRDLPLRTLKELRLFDVSVVTFPAYADTDAAARSAGFDVLTAKLGLDEESRAQLLRHLAFGEELPPDLDPETRDLVERLVGAPEPTEDLRHSAGEGPEEPTEDLRHSPEEVEALAARLDRQMRLRA